MLNMKLFMVMLGCKPEGRLTEQHDIFFGIGQSLESLVPQMISFWKEAKGKIHIDAWREVTQVNSYAVSIVEKNGAASENKNQKLFFINLGGYKENEFEEYHYKILTVAADKGEAVRQSKQTAFYKHYGFKGATSHIDDKYGIDVDDLYAIEDVFPDAVKANYTVQFSLAKDNAPDELHIGYVMIEKL